MILRVVGHLPAVSASVPPMEDPQKNNGKWLYFLSVGSVEKWKRKLHLYHNHKNRKDDVT